MKKNYNGSGEVDIEDFCPPSEQTLENYLIDIPFPFYLLLLLSSLGIYEKNKARGKVNSAHAI